MIMTEGANPRLCPRIVTAGALAGSIEDASTVRVRQQASEIPDNGGGLRIHKSNGVRRSAP